MTNADFIKKQIVSHKTNRLYVRSNKYPNGGLIMGDEVDKFIESIVSTLIERVGSEVESMKGEDGLRLDNYKEGHRTGYNKALSDVCTKLQEMKGKV